jgi:hypothetical protein
MAAGFLVLYSIPLVVSTHKVGLFREPSYEFGPAVAWVSSPNLVDVHEALLRHLMGPCCDFIESLIEVADRKVFQDTSTSSCSLCTASTLGILGIFSLVGGCVSLQLVVGDVIQELIFTSARGFSFGRFSYEDLMIR